MLDFMPMEQKIRTTSVTENFRSCHFCKNRQKCVIVVAIYKNNV